MGKQQAKSTNVTLVVEKHGYKRDFAIEHAERLLSLANNGGWQLPENSPFVYSNGTIERRNKKED